MLTVKDIANIFNIPAGTVSSWNSNKKSAARPLLYNFLKAIPSEEWVKEILNRKTPHQSLTEKQIEVLFGCRKSDHLDLMFKFINNLSKEEIEELLKRAKVFLFLNNSLDLNTKVEDILNHFSLENELQGCYIKENHINKHLYQKTLEYVEKVKKQNPYKKITATEVAKKINIEKLTASKYLNLIEEKENIPIKTESIIKKAVEDLEKQNKKVTIENIQKLTGLSFGAVQKNLKNLKAIKEKF